MFKDLYKQANDKINTDAAKNRVMATLAKPVPARKSHNMARVATLAACFVLTCAAAGIYENMQKETESLPGMTKEMLMAAPTDIVTEGAQDLTPAPTAVPKAPIEKRTAAPKHEEIKSDATNETHREALTTYEVSAPVGEDAQAEDTVVTQPMQENASEKNASSGGGSSARLKSALVINNVSDEPSQAAVARFAMPAKEERYVSVEEYCEEIGKNIPLVADLPEGVKDQTVPVQPMWAGEDKFTFTFVGNEKMVQVEATQNVDSVQAVIDNPVYEKSIIAGNSGVVLAENEILTAYLVSDSVGYTVTTINCTEPELANVLISLN